jgi:2-polyprenyl-6-methoxyphenol hydroxylase-like FAD-dependent oxidoreductase
MTRFDVDVLVVGAGTTGLTLALQAHALGARVRIVERRTEPFRASRATVMHPRTLELLRPLGVTDALLARGDVSPAALLHSKTRVVPVSLDGLGLAGTQFPHLMLIRQADVEAVLVAALADRGVTVERGTELVRLARLRHGGARAVLRRADGEPDENALCRYLIGCDGSASLVRRSVGGWLGGDFAEDAVIADLELGEATPPAAPATLDPEVVHLVVGRRGLVVLFNRGEGATWRLLATRRAVDPRTPAGRPSPPVPAPELQRLLDESGLRTRIETVAWSAQLPLQHRIASRFSRGPLFVAGDAAHTHSPAGAQGMNLGIHDAVNLGWKLAFAASAGRRATSGGSPSPALLDSYAQERRPADLAVLRLTRLMHWVEASTHPLAQLGRAALVPALAPLLPWLARHRQPAITLVRTLAQFRVRYPRSVLSVDARASLVPVRGALARRGLRPGSRVADTLVRCEGRRVRAHDLLATPGVHIFLQADARPVPERLRPPLVHVHRLEDRPGTGMLVVRPDGYAAVRAPVVDEPRLEAWLRLVGLIGEETPGAHRRQSADDKDLDRA